MTSELLEFGRVRLYGINFDYDSDIIRDESKPTLDKIVAMLKSEQAMQLIIEGTPTQTDLPSIIKFFPKNGRNQLNHI